MFPSDFTPAQVRVYSGDSSVFSDVLDTESSTVFRLSAENALTHVKSICEAFIGEIKHLALYSESYGFDFMFM